MSFIQACVEGAVCSILTTISHYQNTFSVYRTAYITYTVWILQESYFTKPGKKKVFCVSMADDRGPKGKRKTTDGCYCSEILKSGVPESLNGNNCGLKGIAKIC